MKQTKEKIEQEFDEASKKDIGLFIMNECITQRGEEVEVNIPKIKQFINQKIIQVLEDVSVEDRKIYEKGAFLEHRNDFNEGYNTKNKKILDYIKKFK